MTLPGSGPASVLMTAGVQLPIGRCGAIGRWVLCSILLCLPGTAVRADADAQRTRADYILHCQGCHLADGSGVPNQVPSLRDQVGAFLRVEGGRAFLVQVPGVSSADLSDARLAAVLNWTLTEFGGDSVPAGMPPYSADEIAAWRKQPLSQVYAVRSSLIKQIREQAR